MIFTDFLKERKSVPSNVCQTKTQQCWECCGNIAYRLHKLSRIHTRGCYDLHYSRGAQAGCYTSYRATGLGKMALRKLANSILQLESDYILNDLWKPRCIVFLFFFKEQKLNFKAFKREKGVLTPYKKVLYYRR